MLFNFNGADGKYPAGGVIMDAQGNLYGTTDQGGGVHEGTVFKLDPSGNETVLYEFKGGSDGGAPWAHLLMDAAGNLYGTTIVAGAYKAGTVFKLDPSGNETVLHSFNGSDGCEPFAGLIMDAQGNLYGTTIFCGAYGWGTVFKLDPSGNVKVLHSFNGSDGAVPYASLLMDAAGNLYGTTYAGGSSSNTCAYGIGCGTVFKLDSSGNETVLYRFTGGSDGAEPFAGLHMDAAGNLYGATVYGGAYGYGTVFKLDPSGKETVLHSFRGSDGRYPGAGVIVDAGGDLYGTTYQGGAYGSGTVFKLDPSGNETVLHSFNHSDGYYPGALMMDAKGNLYGTAFYGGAFCSGSSGGCGTIFEIQNAKATTSTTLASSLNPSIYGQKVIFTSVVSTTGPLPPTGTVAFTWQYFTETFTIGSAKLDSNGVATLVKSNLYAVSYPLTAVYRGDTNNVGSTSPILNQVVQQATSAATITSSLNPSPQGQPVTFTAKITSPTVMPTGPVTFNAGTKVLATAQLSSGKASFTTSSLPTGSVAIKVIFNGDSNIKGSSASVTEVVQP